MNESQIDYHLYHTLKNKNINDFKSFYKGTFASNELSHPRLRVASLKKSKCFGFIFNSLMRHQSNNMGHWLAIVVKNMPKSKLLSIKFFDSYKKPYSFYGTYVTNYINNLRRQSINMNYKFKLENAPFILQDYNSKVCGAYAIYVIARLRSCKQNTLKNIYKHFDAKRRSKNDLKIGEYVAKNWPKKTCSDMLNNPKGVSFCPRKVYNHPKCLTSCICKKPCCQSPKSKEYIRQVLLKQLI